MISLALFFLRDQFTASAASPPVEAAPATISPMVLKQNGHIVHLPGGKAEALSRLYVGDGQGGMISTRFVEKEISLAGGGGTVSLQGPPQDRWPGRRHPEPQGFGEAVAGGEHGPPNRADTP